MRLNVRTRRSISPEYYSLGRGSWESDSGLLEIQHLKVSNKRIIEIQWLSMLAVLQRIHLIPNFLIGQLTTACNSRPKGSKASLASSGTLIHVCTHGYTHTHTNRSRMNCFLSEGWWDKSVDKGTCPRAWFPEFSPQDPCGGGGEPPASCPDLQTKWTFKPSYLHVILNKGCSAKVWCLWQSLSPITVFPVLSRTVRTNYIKLSTSQTGCKWHRIINLKN